MLINRFEKDKAVNFLVLGVILILPVIYLFDFYVMGFPYGQWDWGMPLSLNSVDNAIQIYWSKCLRLNFFGNELLYWIMVKIFIFLFRDKYIFSLIYFFTLISIYYFYKIFYENSKDPSSSILFAALATFPPYLMSRLVAGHLPIYAALCFLPVLIFISMKSGRLKILSVAAIAATVFFIQITPYSVFFLFLTLCYLYETRRVSGARILLITVIAISPFLPSIPGLLEFGSLKGANMQTGEQAYDFNELASRWVALRGNSLSLVELMGTPMEFNMGREMVQSSLYVTNLSFYLIGLLGTIAILYLFFRREFTGIIAVFLCSSLCMVGYLDIVSGFKNFLVSYPNILAAINNPTRFFYILWVIKIDALQNWSMRIHRKIPLLISIILVLTISYLMRPPHQTENYDPRIDQPQKLVFSSADVFGEKFSQVMKSDFYMIPDALFFSLRLNDNPLPWHGKFNSSDLDKYVENSRRLNKYLCDLDYEGLVVDVYRVNKPLVLMNFDNGTSYTNCPRFTPEVLNVIREKLIDSNLFTESNIGDGIYLYQKK